MNKSLFPTRKQFSKLAQKSNVVPVCQKLPADLETPVSVFLKLALQKKQAFLLESVELEDQIGRYSLIGFDPEVTVQYINGQAEIERGRSRCKVNAPFLDVVRDILKRRRFADHLPLPPLVGALVGYIGYELVQQFETIRLRSKSNYLQKAPDAVLFLPTNLIVFDHIKHELILVHLAIIDRKVSNAYRNAQTQIGRLRKKLSQPLRTYSSKSPIRKKKHRSSPKSNISRKQFETMVKTAKSHIRKGDCIQIVLSQCFDLGTIEHPFDLYRELRSLNPSPYMFYYRYRHLTLVGSSPEMLTKKSGRVAEVRPIAGTRPRGETAAEDTMYESSLKQSSKEMAEHLMLVDLGRNDLGRVCKAPTVRVAQFARVERYSHVMHLVSDVIGRLKSGSGPLDLLKATFPAGTVSGAPKIRAMQIIDELESTKRGPYAGCLGYIALNGDMDMCITIRTIVIQKKRASVQAGAGIVNDSNPAREYEETVNKAKALFQAVMRC